MLQGGRAFEQQKTQRPDDHRDNLFDASTGPGSTTGQFGEGSKSTSLYTTHLELHPNRKRITAGALMLGALALVRRIGR